MMEGLVIAADGSVVPGVSPTVVEVAPMETTWVMTGEDEPP